MKTCLTLLSSLLILATWHDTGGTEYAERGPVVVTNTAAAPCPNLVPQSFSLFGPKVVYPGEAIGHRLATFVRNIGTDSSASIWVGLYLSADSDITTSDILLVGGREKVGTIQPGFIEPVPIASGMSIPDWIPAEPWYLGMVIDEDNDVAECNESDNTVLIPITIAAPTASVLTVPEPYDNPSDALAAASNGDTIRIASGVYDDVLVVTKNVIFQGAGAGLTRIQSSLSDSALVTISGASPVFTGLEFYGAGSQPLWVSRGMWIQMASALVEKCTFTGIGNYGIQADTSAIRLDSVRFVNETMLSDVGVEANKSSFTIRKCYGGARIDHVFDPRMASLGVIEDCTIDGSDIYWANGIRVRDQTAAVLRNNVIIGHHTDTTTASLTVGGIATAGPCYVEVDGNTIQGFTYGMNISTQSSVRVHGNSITGNIVEGVHLQYDPKPDLGGGLWNSPGCNDIYNNGPYNVRNSLSTPVYAKNNDWGIGDTLAIDAKLYDDNENATLGQVIYYPYGACTPTGLNVKLWLGAIQVLFEQIVQAGVTAVTNEYVGPPPPDGYAMFPPSPVDPLTWYEFSTSSLFAGNIEVGIPYDETQLTGNESLLKMFHYDGRTWRDITSNIDVDHNIVYGLSSSFSPFIVAGPASCCTGTTGNVNMAGIVDLSDLSLLIAYLTATPRPTLPCPPEANVNAIGIIDLSDLSLLIAYLTATPRPTLPACP